MSFIDRIRLGLHTEVGTIFIGLLLFLAVLGIAYWILSIRQRKKDLFTYLHKSHYEKAQKLAKNLKFTSAHRFDFFGRQTVVQFDDHSYGLCLIPLPEMVEAQILDRFRCFYRAIHAQQLPVLAPYLWKYDEELWILVQGNLLQKDGRFIQNIKYFVNDQKLQNTDKEKILVELSEALAALHRLHDETGEQLYHGFLLPCQLFVELDSHKLIRRVVLADAGLAFSIGSQKLYQRITALKNGKLTIESFRSNEIKGQLSFLPPELLEGNLFNGKGPEGDYFSFGMLAVWIFTQKIATDVNLVNWDKIPDKWHSFTKSCLERDPNKRPKSFTELEDWLTLPELSLTHQAKDYMSEWFDNRQSNRQISEISEESTSEELSLSERFKRIQEKNTQSKGQYTEILENKLSQYLLEGNKAIKNSKWTIAKKHFQDCLKIDSNCAEAYVQLAITFYELEDFRNAEKSYEKAKQINPQAAKQFREHIALRI